MGQFSWIYSDTKEQVKDDVTADTYLLIPKPFQKKYGAAIHETCYNGYGIFGKYDIYDLIPEWNREQIPELVERMRTKKWKCNTSEKDLDNLIAYSKGEPIDCELRWLGIILACFDEDNQSLRYPIKITTEPMDYDEVEPSLSDPNQGW